MAKSNVILVVEDEETFRHFVVKKLKSDYTVYEAASGKEVIENLKLQPEVVILDLRLPHEKGGFATEEIGFRLLEKIKEFDSMIQVIVLTGVGVGADDATKAMKKGAFDYILKDRMSDDPTRLQTAIRNALEKVKDKKIQLRLSSQTQYSVERQRKRYNFDELRKAEGIEYHLGNLVGNSSSMRNIYETIEKISQKKYEPVILLTGETGTGKGMIAAAIHYNSPRKNNLMIEVSIPALSSNLIESALFGHNKGAYTGAIKDEVGYFEKADGTTLFIDEIGEISGEIQTKLLRAIQEKVIQRLGSPNPIPIDVRIIAATNKDLAKAVKEGFFREDLYYRLNVIPIHIPSLRERLEDIPNLARHFIHKFGIEEKEELSLEDKAIEYLKGFDYPGNVRQLEHILERAVYFRSNNIITIDEIKNFIASEKLLLTPIDKSSLTKAPQPIISKIQSPCSKFLQTYIEKGGNLEQVSKRLQISHATVHKYFEQEKEHIFISLAGHHGNIEALAESWGVSAEHLRVALSKQNRILKFIEEKLTRYEKNQEKLADKLDISIDDLQKTIQRLQNIKKESKSKNM
ncbi:MAG: sigma-54 dependent transcriptional regulator [bacterium]